MRPRNEKEEKKEKKKKKAKKIEASGLTKWRCRTLQGQMGRMTMTGVKCGQGFDLAGKEWSVAATEEGDS